jgi:hypothetical protein
MVSLPLLQPTFRSTDYPFCSLRCYSNCLSALPTIHSALVCVIPTDYPLYRLSTLLSPLLLQPTVHSVLSAVTPIDYPMCTTLSGDTPTDYPRCFACRYYNQPTINSPLAVSILQLTIRFTDFLLSSLWRYSNRLSFMLYSTRRDSNQLFSLVCLSRLQPTICFALSSDTPIDYPLSSTLSGETPTDRPLCFACRYYNRLSVLPSLSLLQLTIRSGLPVDTPTDYLLRSSLPDDTTTNYPMFFSHVMVPKGRSKRTIVALKRTITAIPEYCNDPKEEEDAEAQNCISQVIAQLEKSYPDSYLDLCVLKGYSASKAGKMSAE